MIKLTSIFNYHQVSEFSFIHKQILSDLCFKIMAHRKKLQFKYNSVILKQDTLKNCFIFETVFLIKTRQIRCTFLRITFKYHR